MARHCYLCDAEIHGQGYRIPVETGRSRGQFLSRHSYGVSARSYSGLRTVCDSCFSAGQPRPIEFTPWDAKVMTVVGSVAVLIVLMLISPAVGVSILVAAAGLGSMMYRDRNSPPPTIDHDPSD